jgi:hypothetical protein
MAWQRCAMTIENMLKRTLREDITLNRAKAMRKELVYRNALAGTMPLKELGLEADDVEDSMDFYYNLKSREQRIGSEG